MASMASPDLCRLGLLKMHSRVNYLSSGVGAAIGLKFFGGMAMVFVYSPSDSNAVDSFGHKRRAALCI